MDWKCFYLLICLVILSEGRFTSKGYKGMKPTCGIKTAQIPIEKNGCRSSEPIQVNYCDGTCPSATVYHAAYPYFKSHCYCCKASVMKVLQIKLKCPMVDGEEKEEIFVQNTVEKCKCEKCITHIK